MVRRGEGSARSVWLAASGELGYPPARLEKRSQALQGCNLTRNIQADGVPLVPGPLGKLPRGPFLPAAHQSYTSQNPPCSRHDPTRAPRTFGLPPRSRRL